MNADDKKRAVAQKALAFVPDNAVIGVGTGSTVNYFIDALASASSSAWGTVPS